MEAVRLSTLSKIIERADEKNEYDLGSFVSMLYDECHIIVDSDIDDILDYLEDLRVYSDSDLKELSPAEIQGLWEFINQLFFE